MLCVINSLVYISAAFVWPIAVLYSFVYIMCL